MLDKSLYNLFTSFIIILLLLLFKRVMENVISCQWINKRIVIVIVIVIVKTIMGWKRDRGKCVWMGEV